MKPIVSLQQIEQRLRKENRSIKLHRYKKRLKKQKKPKLYLQPTHRSKLKNRTSLLRQPNQMLPLLTNLLEAWVKQLASIHQQCHQLVVFLQLGVVALVCPLWELTNQNPLDWHCSMK